MIWNRNTSPSVIEKSAYSFIYDALNRISNDYYGDGSTLANSEKFREYDYSYDLNGNIITLKRNNNSGTQIDNLSYTYLSGGSSNQLALVGDNTANTSGFNDGNTSGNDYLYDNNGNLTRDLNKGFSTITYNFLNLPNVLTKGATSLTYYYDAMGTKLKQAKVEGENTTSRYYLDGFEYDNSKALSLIHMEEGVINKDVSTFQYEYYIKDHLGSTRISFTPGTNNTVTLVQSTDYYPFGLEFSPQYDNSSGNKYLYNGKELQDGLSLDWYDYGARFYDPGIGRFITQDPRAEDYDSWTPYNYCADNPIFFMDLDGMDWYTNWFTGKQVWFDGSDKHFFYSHNEGGYYSSPTATVVDYSYSTLHQQAVDYVSALRFEQTLNASGIQTNRTDSRFEAFASWISLGALPEIKGLSGFLKLFKGSQKNVVKSVEELISVANTTDKGGLTTVGRALQKHGSRAGSVFPKVAGSPAVINAQGEAVLRDIITNPSVSTTIRHHARLGDVLEYRIPSGQGARFSSDGKKFFGFIEQ